MQLGVRMHRASASVALITYFRAISRLGPLSFRSSASASPASNLILVGDSIAIPSFAEVPRAVIAVRTVVVPDSGCAGCLDALLLGAPPVLSDSAGALAL